jgi:type IV pilus assembly protein PilQ
VAWVVRVAWVVWVVASASPATVLAQTRTYSGAPVDLDVQGADIRAVLRAIADLGGLNIVIDPGVSGPVDIKLTRVPWDHALEILLKTGRLGYVLDDAVVRVAPMTVLAAEEDARQKLLEARAPATVTLRTFPLSHARAVEMEPLIKTAVLSKHGDSRVDVRTNTLIIRDVPERLQAAADLLASLDRREPQVEIEARIVQTTRDAARALGVQWGPGVQESASGAGVIVGSLEDPVTLDVALSALERAGQGQILSAPRVTTQNNTQAEMTQGIQVPIQSVSNNTVSVTFKDAALKLLVTPRTTAPTAVLLDVELENATPDFARQVNNIPPIDTQRARTTVQVEDGATTVIGGIYVSREQSSQERTPGLHRVPLLGWLFRRQSRQEETRELLIFITPRIVR